MVLIVGGSYQGKIEFAKEYFPGSFVFDKLHLFIKQCLEEDKSEAQILEEIRKRIQTGDWVIISDELGNGIVPMDEGDVRWREVTGRILIELAREADRVYRVILGMGQRIK
ncbi:MAG: bifunctional adenosylcobinamide kinase/adenosylcobinamide-phosphate guanylyltransferase [Lachnospiraceae bacterium]|nr:bifunctional adenosylcobinamide kinase/adenosylcobinamide-phosphate guanylyltransferase [Lachnospiraceae bacterium]